MLIEYKSFKQKTKEYVVDVYLNINEKMIFRL